MLNALNGSIQAELVRFFNVSDASYLSTKSVSIAAFYKARMKLSHQAFIELNAWLDTLLGHLNFCFSSRLYHSEKSVLSQ